MEGTEAQSVESACGFRAVLGAVAARHIAFTSRRWMMQLAIFIGFTLGWSMKGIRIQSVRTGKFYSMVHGCGHYEFVELRDNHPMPWKEDVRILYQGTDPMAFKQSVINELEGGS